MVQAASPDLDRACGAKRIENDIAADADPSSTTIEATSPAHAAGAVDVTVTSAKGTSATGSGDHFTYRAKPTVTNMQPNAGPLAGGTTVMISGTGFTNASKVSFGATAATSFTVISDSWISAISPAGSGTVEVSVTTAGGTSTTSKALRFDYRSGNPFGWGDNSAGELGDGTTSGPESCSGAPCAPLPVSAGSFSSEVTAVSAGVDHGLALLANGTVMAWGGDGEGEMCTPSASSTPVSVGELSEVRAVSAGGYDTLALLKDGTVRACGRNPYGELGNSTTTNSSVPVEVSGITEAVAISAGGEYSLALLKSGKVMAWGNGASGKLGNGGTTNSTVPVEVSGLSEVTAISAGSAHALALQNGGSVQSWGANQSGQLGTCEFEGSPRSCSKVPVTVSGLTNAVGIEGGVNFALGLGSTPSFTQTIDSGHTLNACACAPGTTDCVAGDSPGNAFYAENASASGSATWKSWTGPGVGASHALACPTTALCLLAAGEQEKGGSLYYATSLGGSWTLAYAPLYGVDAISSLCVATGSTGAVTTFDPR